MLLIFLSFPRQQHKSPFFPHFEPRHTQFFWKCQRVPKSEHYITSLSITSWKIWKKGYFDWKLKGPSKKHPLCWDFFFPLKTELTVTLINQWHLLQLAHCAQLCSNQSHSGWMSTFQAGRGTAARALSAVIYWRHLGKGSLIHLYNMLAFQVLVIKHQRELGGSFTPVTSETE